MDNFLAAPSYRCLVRALWESLEILSVAVVAVAVLPVLVPDVFSREKMVIHEKDFQNSRNINNEKMDLLDVLQDKVVDDYFVDAR